jgi:hypothetical protein
VATSSGATEEEDAGLEYLVPGGGSSRVVSAQLEPLAALEQAGFAAAGAVAPLRGSLALLHGKKGAAAREAGALAAAAAQQQPPPPQQQQQQQQAIGNPFLPRQPREGGLGAKRWRPSDGLLGRK